MKNLILITSFFLITFNVFAHEMGQPIKLTCLISEYNVMDKYSGEPCKTKDVNESVGECKVRFKIDFSAGPNDLKKLRGGKMIDLKVDITFKDGKKYSSINKFHYNSRSIYPELTGEKVSYFYRKEDPSSIDCVVL